MPKKKPIRNAFFYFMLDFKARCERNGERFPNGLRDVQTEASPEWDAMPPSAKKKYEDMAKEEKARSKGNGGGYRETCCHNTFSSIDMKKREEEEEKARTTAFIESTIQSLSKPQLLADYKFYLIHVNYFCISEGECYHPAELAIAEFSLSKGVTNVYHTLIDPGQIPLGYRFDAVKKSESTHKIPIEDNGGERNFYKILADIKKFIKPGMAASGGEYPPLYTMPENVNLNISIKAVKSVMYTLCTSDSYECDNVDKYQIYPIEKLFFELKNASCKLAQKDKEAMPNMSLALIELEKDVFNFTQEIACEFHCKEDAVEFCSKSYVQRWVYLICDHCCQYVGVDIVPGKHLPLHSDVNYRKNKEIEAEVKPEPREFTWTQPAAERQPWEPVEHPPVPRPTKQANLAAMLPPRETANPNLDLSEPDIESLSLSNFPSLDGGFVLGRGKTNQYHRGGRGGRGGGQGSQMSFASAMKK